MISDNDFTKEQIDAAVQRKLYITKYGSDADKANYMVGEILMHEELRQANEAVGEREKSISVQILKELIRELTQEKYQQERNGIANAALALVDTFVDKEVSPVIDISTNDVLLLAKEALLNASGAYDALRKLQMEEYLPGLKSCEEIREKALEAINKII